jgi:CHASE2 domain-containing sensor protein
MKSNARWRRNAKSYFILAGSLLASAVVAMLLDFTSFGQGFDKSAYDFLSRLEPPKPWQPDSIVLAIDEKTLSKYPSIRAALADGLEKIAPAHPRVVAIDIILAEQGPNEQTDANLEKAFAATPNLILASYLLKDDTWNEPLPRFRRHAAAIAQVHGDVDRYDSVMRMIALEAVGGHERRWALSFQAWLMANRLSVADSPGDLGIPTAGETHEIRIRYAPNGIPEVAVDELDTNPKLAAQFAGRVVFVGDTAQASRDTWMTPVSNRLPTPGVEIHANAYETLQRRMFLRDASLTSVLLCCLLLASATGFIYTLTSGWVTNAAAALVVAASQAIPAIAFANSVVWPWLPVTLTAAFAVSAGAAWRLLVVGRQLLASQSEKDRYQKAMQFVTH